MFSKPMTEINLLFYEFALQTFVLFNKFLQREDPLLPILCGQIDSFLNKLASKFVPVTKIKAAKKNFFDLQYKGKDNQLQGEIKFTDELSTTQYLLFLDENLFIGLLTKSVIRKKLDEGDITQQNVTKFYASVRAFHEKAFEYALDKLPLKDDLLMSGQFVDIVSRESANFPQVEYFIER